MSAGQGYELMARKNNIIPSVTEVLRIFENKTGQAFKVSLLTGAIAGGADSILIYISASSYPTPYSLEETPTL